MLGEENETYTVKDGSYYPILPEFDKLNKGRWFYPTNSQELYTPLFSARAHKETEMGELYDDITAKCMSFNYNRLNNILPILPEAEKYESKLSALAEEKMMKMILDQGELDKFDEFVTQWKAEGRRELTADANRGLTRTEGRRELTADANRGPARTEGRRELTAAAGEAAAFRIPHFHMHVF